MPHGRDERPYQRGGGAAILGPMGFTNAIVAGVLRSPAHGLLSGSTALVRYTGRRSGRQVTTPVQYAAIGEGGDLVILVGRPETKTWWRNFTHDRALEVLVRREWQPMVGRAVIGADDPGAMTELLEVYLRRFPKASKALPGGTLEDRVGRAVAVRCRLR